VLQLLDLPAQLAKAPLHVIDVLRHLRLVRDDAFHARHPRLEVIEPQLHRILVGVGRATGREHRRQQRRQSYVHGNPSL